MRWTLSCSGSSLSQKTDSNRDAALRLCRGKARGQQTIEPVQCAFTQALTFRQQPFLERRRAQMEAVEQLAAIELARALQRMRRIDGDEALELQYVDADAIFLQANRIGIGAEQSRVLRRQRAAQLTERLAQALTRLGLAAILPEQCGELVARLRLARMKRQVSEQRLGLFVPNATSRPDPVSRRNPPSRLRTAIAMAEIAATGPGKSNKRRP